MTSNILSIEDDRFDLVDFALIEKQMNIETAIGKIKESTSIAKEFCVKHLEYLYSVTANAIDGDPRAVNYLEKLGKRPLIYPELYTDGEGNMYEIKGINESTLNNYWKVFDKQYNGSVTPGHYLNALEKYIRAVCGYKNFTVTQLSKKRVMNIKRKNKDPLSSEKENS